MSQVPFHDHSFPSNFHSYPVKSHVINRSDENPADIRLISIFVRPRGAQSNVASWVMPGEGEGETDESRLFIG